MLENGMIFYVENPKLQQQEQLLELLIISDYSKVAGYKVNIHQFIFYIPAINKVEF